MTRLMQPNSRLFLKGVQTSPENADHNKYAARYTQTHTGGNGSICKLQKKRENCFTHCANSFLIGVSKEQERGGKERKKALSKVKVSLERQSVVSEMIRALHMSIQPD